MLQEKSIITSHHLFWCQPLLLYAFIVSNCEKLVVFMTNIHSLLSIQMSRCYVERERGVSLHRIMNPDLRWTEVNTTAVCLLAPAPYLSCSDNSILKDRKMLNALNGKKYILQYCSGRALTWKGVLGKKLTVHISENQGFGTNRLAGAPQTISISFSDRHDWVLQRRRGFLWFYTKIIFVLVCLTGCQAFLC